MPAGLAAPAPAPDGSLTATPPGVQSVVTAPAQLKAVDTAPPDPPAATKKAAQGFVAGKSTEIVGERRADAKVFANPDGTRTERIYAKPQHFKDAKGNWQDINDTAVADGAGLRNAAGPVDVRFAGAGDSARLVEVSADGHRIAFSLEGAAPSKPLANGATVSYPAIAAGADLELRMLGDTMKETIILSRPPAGGANPPLRRRHQDHHRRRRRGRLAGRGGRL